MELDRLLPDNFMLNIWYLTSLSNGNHKGGKQESSRLKAIWKLALDSELKTAGWSWSTLKFPAYDTLIWKNAVLGPCTALVPQDIIIIINVQLMKPISTESTFPILILMRKIYWCQIPNLKLTDDQ